MSSVFACRVRSVPSSLPCPFMSWISLFLRIIFQRGSSACLYVRMLASSCWFRNWQLDLLRGLLDNETGRQTRHSESAQALKLLTCVLEIPVLNLGRGTNSFHSKFRGCSSVPNSTRNHAMTFSFHSTGPTTEDTQTELPKIKHEWNRESNPWEQRQYTQRKQVKFFNVCKVMTVRFSSTALSLSLNQPKPISNCFRFYTVHMSQWNAGLVCRRVFLRQWSNLSFEKLIVGRWSQWPRGLRHEMSLPTRTLGSWDRTPFKAWMFVFILCLCVDSGLTTGWSPVQGILPTV
jgi:hypothetical protein